MEHVRDWTSGVVRVDGNNADAAGVPSIEGNHLSITRTLEWDVSELSFGKYAALPPR